MTRHLAAEPLREEIHVWIAKLDSGTASRLTESETLSPDELDRARRYRFEDDRRRFVVARAALRYLLAGYLDVVPASVRLVTGPRGKPHVDSEASSWLRFNMSRSQDLAVFAVTSDREVGVDVEQVRADVDLDPLVGRVLSLAERSALDLLAPDSRCLAFYRYWTRKEAFLKGLGVGFLVEPNEVDVTGDHVKPLTRGQLSGLSARRSGWSLYDADLGPGYVAAVAFEGDLVRPPVMRGWIVEALATSAR